MSKEKLTRREFIINTAKAAAGAGLYIFLPRVSSRETQPGPYDQWIGLIDEHSMYNLRVNPSFAPGEIEILFTENNKRKMNFHWVDSDEEVPWAGAPQRGSEWDGETGMIRNRMMVVYSQTFPQDVTFWIWTNPEYYQYISERRGEEVTRILSRSLSFKLWQAVKANDRGYLWGAVPSPNPTWEEILKYFYDNPLILASQQA